MAEELRKINPYIKFRGKGDCILMRKRFIAGNWKMFNGPGLTCDFFNKFDEILNKDEGIMEAISDKKIEAALFPPSISIPAAVSCRGELPVIIGAQNCHYEKSGAYTGELSAQMLKETGCTHVIIGHSERRHIFGEKDEILNKKVLAAIGEQLTVVFCVGELLEERENGETFGVVEKQIMLGLDSVTPEDIEESIIIAYEPVWAIGTGKTASDQDAQEVCSFIRERVAAKYGQTVAEKILILYGGSVKPENTRGILSQPDIDGVLVGGASLKADSFSAIIKESL